MSPAEAKKKLRLLCKNFRSEITLDDLKTQSDKEWFSILNELFSLTEIAINKTPKKQTKLKEQN